MIWETIKIDFQCILLKIYKNESKKVLILNDITINRIIKESRQKTNLTNIVPTGWEGACPFSHMCPDI